MTRIVYASPDYIPPPGIIALPLHEHPAIAEDTHSGRTAPLRSRKPYYRAGKPRRLALAIADYLKVHEAATVTMLAAAIGVTRSAIAQSIERQPHLFVSAGAKGSKPAVWRLRP